MGIFPNGKLNVVGFVKRNKLWIALSVIGILLAILLVSTWQSADDNTRFGVVAASIGLFATVVGASITHSNTKKREIEAIHFTEKRQAYVGFLDILLSLSQQGRKLQPLEKKMMDLKKGLLFWGDDDFIRVWNKVEKPGEDPLSALRNLDDILRWMRSDLGHNNSSLQKGDLADFLLVAKDRGQLRK